MSYSYLDDGKIITVDEIPEHAKMSIENHKAGLDEQNALIWRGRRDYLLSETDWVITRATEEGSSVADKWKTYRQSLRDLPTHSKWPNIEESDLPTKPS